MPIYASLILNEVALVRETRRDGGRLILRANQREQHFRLTIEKKYVVLVIVITRTSSSHKRWSR